MTPRACLAAASSGAAFMALEICGPRLLAPAYGSGTIVWSVLLAAMLLSMGLGNLLGGRLADDRASLRWLAGMLLLGAIACAASGFLGRAAALYLSDRFASGAGQVMALVLSCVLLFAPPALLLAAVFPLALRLSVPSLERTGRTYGLLYACAALGSVAGLLAPPFILVGCIGTSWTVAAFAALAAVAALVVQGGVLCLAAALPLFLLADRVRLPADFSRWETSYAAYAVMEHGGSEYLAVNGGNVAYSLYRPNARLSGQYFDTFTLAPFLTATQALPRRIAILGLAGGTAAHQLRAAFPQADIEAAEIDESLVRLARTRYHLDDLRVSVSVTDARCFLRRSTEPWDMIVIDVLVGNSVPVHLTSAEFFHLVAQHLSPHGVAAMQVMQPLTDIVAATAATAFPHVRQFRSVIVASADDLEVGRLWGAVDRLGWGELRDTVAGLQREGHVAKPLALITDDRGGAPWWWGLR